MSEWPSPWLPIRITRQLPTSDIRLGGGAQARALGFVTSPPGDSHGEPAQPLMGAKVKAGDKPRPAKAAKEVIRQRGKLGAVRVLAGK